MCTEKLHIYIYIYIHLKIKHLHTHTSRLISQNWARFARLQNGIFKTRIKLLIILGFIREGERGYFFEFSYFISPLKRWKSLQLKIPNRFSRVEFFGNKTTRFLFFRSSMSQFYWVHVDLSTGPSSLAACLFIYYF